MQSSNEDIVIEHALSSSTNLEIAIDVAFAYDELRYRIIGNAMAELTRLLRSSDHGQNLDLRTTFTKQPIPAYAAFWARRKQWPAEYRVILQSDPKDAKELYLGVHHGDGDPLIEWEAVHEHLAHLRPGKTKETLKHGWSWWFWVEAPLASWTTKEAILALRSGQAAKVLARDFLDIINAMDGLLTSTTSE